MPVYPEIVVGTYEEFLLGYEIVKSDDGTFKLNTDMASHAHQGSIRCVAAYRHLLASSGADEYVNVFSMVNRKEVAILTPHAGTVTALVFAPDGSHLISGSQDGSIVIFRCSDWTMMKVWKDAHRKANGVVGLSVHPSGKLLLSIGADHILRVWNLVKGRQAYAVNFGKRISPGQTLNLVTWSHDGSHYAVAIGQAAEVYSVDTAAVVYAVKSPSRISCFDLSEKGIIALGRDDGMMEIHDLQKKEQILEHQGHEKRVKCLQFFKLTDEELFLVSADSQGVIRLWRWKRHRKVQRLHLEAEVNADCRIVCLTLLNPNDFVKKETEETASENLEESVTVVNSEADANQSPNNGLTKNKNKKKSKLQNSEASGQSTALTNDRGYSQEEVLKKVNQKKKRKQESVQTVEKRKKEEVVTKAAPSTTVKKRQSVKSPLSTDASQRANLSPASKGKSENFIKKTSGTPQRKRSSTSKWSIT